MEEPKGLLEEVVGWIFPVAITLFFLYGLALNIRNPPINCQSPEHYDSFACRKWAVRRLNHNQ